MKEDKYREIYDHYNTLGLIKHRKLTPEMRSAIDVARRRGEYDWNDLKTLLDRHAEIVKATEGNEYPVHARPLAKFFGQKVYNGTVLICSEYADDGEKWIQFMAGGMARRKSAEVQRASFERPITNGSHLYLDPFAEEDAP